MTLKLIQELFKYFSTSVYSINVGEFGPIFKLDQDVVTNISKHETEPKQDDFEVYSIIVRISRFNKEDEFKEVFIEQRFINDDEYMIELFRDRDHTQSIITFCIDKDHLLKLKLETT